MSDKAIKPSFPPRMAGWQFQYERAERLRGLLRRWNDKRVQETHEDCYFCGASVQVDTTPPPKTEIVFTDNHTANCELARELEKRKE